MISYSFHRIVSPKQYQAETKVQLGPHVVLFVELDCVRVAINNLPNWSVVVYVGAIYFTYKPICFKQFFSLVLPASNLPCIYKIDWKTIDLSVFFSVNFIIELCIWVWFSEWESKKPSAVFVSIVCELIWFVEDVHKSKLIVVNVSTAPFVTFNLICGFNCFNWIYCCIRFKILLNSIFVPWNGVVSSIWACSIEKSFTLSNGRRKNQ